MKAIIKVSILAIVGLLLLSGFINILERAFAIEYANAPRPSLEHLDDMCGQGYEDACEAYLDRVNEVAK